MRASLFAGIGLADASGSFRGARFRLDNYSTDIGRRLDVREYPLRNLPSTDDLGRKARRFAFSAYVLGDFWEIERDALLRACEEDGPGTLVHPFHGEHEVYCDQCSVGESRDGGIRYATFDLLFVEAGKFDSPNYEPDPGYRLLTQADDTFAVSEAAF